MAQKLNLKCFSCAQVLAVDASLAGQQVRCPKCQGLTLVPQQSVPQQSRAPNQAVASTQNSASSTQRTPAPPGQVTVCPTCSKKMSVKLLDRPSEVQCPGCQTRLRLPARTAPAPSRTRPAPSRSAPAAAGSTPQTQPQPQSPPRPAAPAPSLAATTQASVPVDAPASAPVSSPTMPANASGPVATPTAATDPFATPAAPGPASGPAPASGDPFGNGVDFGQLDADPLGSSTAAPSSFAGNQSAKGSGGFNAFLAWAGEHKLLCGIIAINVFALFGCVAFPPLLLVCAVQLPIGLVLGGALFLPRFHLIDKITGAIGGQVAGMGAGGIALLVLLGFLKFGLRASRRASRNENLDFSGFDASTIGTIIGSLAVIAAFFAVFIVLWKYIGIVRTLAAGYLLEMVIFMPMLVLGGIWKNYEEAAREQRHQETLERMKSPDFARSPGMSTPGYRPPTFAPQGSSSTVDSGKIRLLVSRRTTEDVETIETTLLGQIGNPKHETNPRGPIMVEFVIDDDRNPQEVARLITGRPILYVSELNRMIRLGPSRP